VHFRDIGFLKNTPNPADEASFDENSVHVRIWRGRKEITKDVIFGYSFAGDLDELGNPIACYPASETCESIFIDTLSEDGLHGKILYEYKYVIRGVTTQYSDISDIFWSLYSYSEEVLYSSSIVLNLPKNNANISDILAWSKGGTTSKVEVLSNTKIQIILMGSESATFSLLVPTVVFPNISETNKVSDNSYTQLTLISFYDNFYSVK
jgi:hypothetical protein